MKLRNGLVLTVTIQGDSTHTPIDQDSVTLIRSFPCSVIKDLHLNIIGYIFTILGLRDRPKIWTVRSRRCRERKTKTYTHT
jgi:hypothetical protein